MNRPEPGADRSAVTPPTPYLTDPQVRAVAATLRRLEETLFHAEHLLAGDQLGILLSVRATFDALERRHLRSLITEARLMIATLAETFALPHQERDARRVLDGQLVQSWSSLEGTRPRRLEGYGPMDPAAAALLDPCIGRLIDLVNAMRDEVLT